MGDQRNADSAIAAHDLHPEDRCVSWVYDLKHKKPKRGPHCRVYQKPAHDQRPPYKKLVPPPCPAYQELAPGRSFSIPFNFTKTGDVELTISADVSSGVAIELAVLDAQGREKRATLSSTQIAGPYAVDLEAPGAYELRITNPRSSNVMLAGRFKITMCGEPAVEYWLRQHIEQSVVEMVRESANIPMAPMGIAVYGIRKDGEKYSTYRLTTDAVRGVAYIPPGISALGYRLNGSYYGQAFSVQLNAFVAAQLANKETEYYWVQNIVGLKESKILDKIRNIMRRSKFNELNVYNYIENVTTATSTLDKSRVRGKGKVYWFGCCYYYRMPGSIPFGLVVLETRTRVDDGKIIVEFYVNGKEYDKVAITPRVPATSAHIEIAPATTPTGYPLNLELVFGGYHGGIPFTVLKSGWIGLKLYVRKNGEWVPPPSAWDVGYVTFRRSYANVVPQDVGSALVLPVTLNPRQLWSSPDFNPP